jgi:hypothetical protein
MQRKQQVGECWVCVIFFACVCVGVRFDNWSDLIPTSFVFVSCALGFLLLRINFSIFFGQFFSILADFVIFSGFLN